MPCPAVSAAGAAREFVQERQTCPRLWPLSDRGRGMQTDVFLPAIARIVAVRDETPDTKTYCLRFRSPWDADAFQFAPGQFVELSVFGHGEAPFCIASSPTQPGPFEITVRRTGNLTDALHRLSAGDEVGIRGPFGNGFDVNAARGSDLLFVAGGLGLPALRSLIRNVLDEREQFGRVTILYGARTPADLIYRDELGLWRNAADVEVRVSVDIAAPGWSGNVGVVTVLFEQTHLRPDSTLAYVCGPPVMIGFVVDDLVRRGFPDTSVISTLERMMQ